MENYLNDSVKHIYNDFVEDSSILNDEYNFYLKYTLKLYSEVKPNQILNKNINNKICMAACFWITSKLFDDDHYSNNEIRFEFNLNNISARRLNLAEIRILKKKDWKFDY